MVNQLLGVMDLREPSVSEVVNTALQLVKISLILRTLAELLCFEDCSATVLFASIDL